MWYISVCPILFLGTFGTFGVDCPHVSPDGRMRRRARGNQAEIRLQVAFGALKLGHGQLADIVVADHVISTKQ
jgi:hypothetical protein